MAEHKLKVELPLKCTGLGWVISATDDKRTYFVRDIYPCGDSELGELVTVVEPSEATIINSYSEAERILEHCRKITDKLTFAVHSCSWTRVYDVDYPKTPDMK